MPGMGICALPNGVWGGYEELKKESQGAEDASLG